MLGPIIGTNQYKTKRQINKYINLAMIALGSLAIAYLVIGSVVNVIHWFDEYKMEFQNPIQNFIIITPRPTALKHNLIKQAEAKSPEEMTTEEYICYKFGEQCNLALAVSQAENGTRQCDRININSNNTIDVGIFQLNSIHLKKGYTLSDFINCKTNVDIAYTIYEEQGFSPWVAYTNKSYKQFLTD